MNQYLQELKEDIKPQSNYVRFNDGDRKVLLFVGDLEHIYKVEDPKFGTRVRCVVTDITDPMRPVENRIWDVSRKWGNKIIDLVDKNQECLEITRHGSGMGTDYDIYPATPNQS